MTDLTGPLHAPVTGPYPSVAYNDLPKGAQHEGHSVVGDGAAVCARRIGDADPSTRCRIEVNRVHSDAVSRHQAQPRRGVQVSDRDRSGACDPRDGGRQ